MGFLHSRPSSSSIHSLARVAVLYQKARVPTPSFPQTSSCSNSSSEPNPNSLHIPNSLPKHNCKSTSLQTTLQAIAPHFSHTLARLSSKCSPAPTISEDAADAQMRAKAHAMTVSLYISTQRAPQAQPHPCHQHHQTTRP
jgi:hypothetical protein